MSADTEALRWRIQALEKGLTRINDLIPELEARLNWLEYPPAQVVENTETPEPVTCPECGGTAIESKGCTAILPDRGIQHHCQRCEHYWRVNIKGAYLPEIEKRGQVYRIVYRTADGGNPTFVHVRAENAISALMAFIDETSSLKVSSLKLDNEYDGPRLNERAEAPAGKAAKQMEEALPPGIYEAVVLVADVPDRAGRVFSKEELREMAKYKGFEIRLEYGKLALVAQVTVPVAHVQETNDEDDTKTGPVVREGA